MSETTAAPVSSASPTPVPATEAFKATESVESNPSNTPKLKYKVKVDGNELEVEENDLVANYQKGVSADKRFKEAAELKKQLEMFVDNVKSNPEFLLKELGINPYEFYQNKLLEHLEREHSESQLTPDQKELRELKAWKDRFEKEQKDFKERRNQEEQAHEEAKIIESLDVEIAASFAELGIKRPTAEMVADLAEQMLAEYKTTKQRLPAKDAIERSKTSFQKRLNSWTNESPERILELIPEQYLERIAQAYLSKKTGAQIPSVKSNTPSTHTKQINSSIIDFFKKGY